MIVTPPRAAGAPTSQPEPSFAAPPPPGASDPKLGSIPGRDLGLCVTCDLRRTCTFREVPAGVWHCEEFA